MQPHRWPLAWRLATLPVLVALVTGGAAFVVARHALLGPLETRAQQQVDQAAALMADQIGRVLSRRVSEMQLVARSSPWAAAPTAALEATAIEALQQTSPAYQWIAIVDAQGRVRAASDGAPAGRSIADWAVFRSAAGPVVIGASLRPMNGPAALADLLVRLDGSGEGAPRWLAAQLSRVHADALRDLVLGAPPARRTLDVRLVDAAGHVLLGPASAVKPPAPAAGDRMFDATRPLEGLPSAPVPGWLAVATQDRAAALALAHDLERRLFATLVITCGFLALGGWWLSRRLTRPYDSLLGAVSRRLREPAGKAPADFNRALDALAAELRDERPDSGSPLTAIARDAERLRSLIDGMPLATVVTDLDGRVKLWTRGAESLFGYPATAAVGRPLRELLRGDMLTLRSDALQRQLAGASAGVPPTRARVLRQDGRPVWIEWVGIRLGGDAGNPVDLLMQARDRTAEREARTRARLSARRLAIVLEAARDTSFILLDAQGQVVEWSRGTELMGRWPPGTLAGQSHEIFFTPQDRAAGLPAGLRDQATRLGRAHFEGWRVRRDGSRFWGEVTLYPVPGVAPAQSAGYVQVVRDLTAQHLSAEIMRQAREGLSDLARRLMEQEKLTTQRVAQALHDRLGQFLAALRMHTESLQALPPERLWAEWRERAPTIDRLHAEAMREVRQVLTELRPPLLDELGLVAALDNELRTHPARGTGTDLLLDAPDSARTQRWPASVEYAAFMIAREAITNALRHAGSPVVRVEVGGGPSHLHLSVADDGARPLVDAVERPGHLGLVGMRERALAIGAQLTIRAGSAREGQRGTEVLLVWHDTAESPAGAPLRPTPASVDARSPIDTEATR
jgi:PAS domain S-box-containing protein